jgi:transcriptional regulator with XRE-family HTH domain
MSALGDHLNRVIKEKGISFAETQRRSEGKISDSYIQDIISGKTRRPSAVKLMALAAAIGEDYKELSELAAGKKATKGWTDNSLEKAIVKNGREREGRGIRKNHR